jgi:hypothetical protein
MPNRPFAIISDESRSSRSWAVDSTAEVFSRIDELGASHDRWIRWRAQTPSSEDRKTPLGYSVQLTNQWGHKLHVGIHPLGWKLIRLLPPPIRGLKGNLQGREIVAFMFPEWTEFYRDRLRDPESARRVIEEWLERDVLEESLFS